MSVVREGRSRKTTQAIRATTTTWRFPITVASPAPTSSTLWCQVRRSPPKKTPAKPFLAKTDFNLSPSNKLTVRYSQLDSSSDQNLSGSSSLGFGRGTFGTNFLNFARPAQLTLTR